MPMPIVYHKWGLFHRFYTSSSRPSSKSMDNIKTDIVLWRCNSYSLKSMHMITGPKLLHKVSIQWLALVSYSRDHEFNYQPRDQPSDWDLSCSFFSSFMEVPNSNLSPQTSNPDWGFHGFPHFPGKFQDRTLNYAIAASFHTLYNSSRTYHPFIWHYIACIIEKPQLNKL
jgi:hypothetical protein